MIRPCDIRKAIEPYTPPVLWKLYDRVRHPAKMPGDFRHWWETYPDRGKLPEGLTAMLDTFVTTDTCRESSAYWLWLNQQNICQIAASGYANFRQTVSKNYYTWVGMDEAMLARLFAEPDTVYSGLDLGQIIMRHESLTNVESVNHNLITAMLLNYCMQHDFGSVLEKIEEPRVGNPPGIHYSDRFYTQDTLNSVLEFASIREGCDPDSVTSVLEIGAGSGRTAHVLMQLMPKAKYMIVDIPPALYLSQTSLSEFFADRKVFRFRPFTSFEEVREEFEAADIAFLMPDQLKLLPDRSVDLFLAIDCLHEMARDHIGFYFDAVDRLAKRFFFKCWREAKVPFDKIQYTQKDYPVQAHWREVYVQEEVFPANYFKAFYSIAD